MSDHSSDRTTIGAGGKFAGMEVSSDAKSPELAPDQELSAPPPDDIEPETPQMEAPRIEAEAKVEARADAEPMIETAAPAAEASGTGPEFEAEAASKADAPRIEPGVEAAAPAMEAPKLEAEIPKLEAINPEVASETPKTDAAAPRVEPRTESEAPAAQTGETHPELEAEASKADAPRIDTGVEAATPKMEAPKLDAQIPKVEAINPNVRSEPPKTDAADPAGKMMVVTPPRDRSWDRATIDKGSATAGGAQPKRRLGKRLSAIAAIAVLAAITGAVGGSLATSGLGHGAGSEQSSAMASRTAAMEATITRLESEVAALKSGIERSAKGEAGRFARVNDRLDKVEKAHAESTTKLAKLNEALEKQHVPAAPAAAQATAATNVTGSIPTAAAPVPLPAAKPKAEVAHLPAVEGWVLRDIANGGALIEGRGGLYEVYAGDPVPGLGRVDAIRRQDGRWVVVTSRGLIVGR